MHTASSAPLDKQETCGKPDYYFNNNDFPICT